MVGKLIGLKKYIAKIFKVIQEEVTFKSKRKQSN